MPATGRARRAGTAWARRGPSSRSSPCAPPSALTSPRSSSRGLFLLLAPAPLRACSGPTSSAPGLSQGNNSRGRAIQGLPRTHTLGRRLRLPVAGEGGLRATHGPAAPPLRQPRPGRLLSPPPRSRGLRRRCPDPAGRTLGSPACGAAGMSTQGYPVARLVTASGARSFIFLRLYFMSSALRNAHLLNAEPLLRLIPLYCLSPASQLDSIQYAILEISARGAPRRHFTGLPPAPPPLIAKGIPGGSISGRQGL